MKERKRRPALVREPIQVYLTPDDRGLLDQLAESGGLSRAEVIRRALRALAASKAGKQSRLLDLMERLAKEEWPENIAVRHDEILAEEYLSPHREEGAE